MTGYEVAVRAEATLGEGPTWDTDAQWLIWVDVLGSRVPTHDPATGRRTVLATVIRPTACAFGGADLADLYITTARTGLTAPHPLSGSMLVVPGAGKGLPQPAFAG